MSILKLVFRSLIFYRRTHIGTVLGTALATAILVGALVVGDSVRFSLRQMVSERLGSTTYALETDTRYFRQSLAENLSLQLNTVVAPLLQTKGIAIIGGGRCFKKSTNLARFQGATINSLEYKRPIYEESSQNIDMAIMTTASIKPGIDIPMKAKNVKK